MTRFFFLLLFLFGLLHAQSDQTASSLIIESDTREVDHESAYGVTNSYTYLVAGHQIQADDSLQLYYGTKVGVVSESYTAENGFGQDAENAATVLEIDMGLHYALEDLEQLTLQGSRLQNTLHEQQENRVEIGYQYKF
jgi:hypothetical protein